MSAGHDEIETKYDVDDGFELPPGPEVLAGASDLAAVEGGPSQDLRLEATYFDTVDHRLFHAGLTLRRRTGGKDDGWHLKVPTGDGVRREVRVALGRSATTVPLRLRRLVWMHTRDEPLVPVLRLTTARTERQLLVEGRAVAELADDRVTAERLLSLGPDETSEDAKTLVWREIEVELTGGDRKLLKRVDRQLRELGAHPSASSSKLARGLGLRSAPDPTVKQLKQARRGLSPTSPAGEVIVTYLSRELARVRANDLPVRLDLPDSLHTMRVSTRRLRSGLDTFAALFETGRVEPLEQELKWLADVLGRARDGEVLRARLADAVGTEQARHLSTGRVTQTVDREMARRQRAAFAEAAAALDSERYRLLVVALEELVADPPLTARGHKPARQQLRKPVTTAYDKVRQAVLAGAELPRGDDRDQALHSARKAAKRARYSAEAVAPAFGPPATAFAKEMERLQDVLGERNDSVAMQAKLHELAREASAVAAFTYGRLHAREGVHQDQVDAAVGRAWKAAAKPSRRAWL